MALPLMQPGSLGPGSWASSSPCYEDQAGGVPLWVEIQSVTTDAQGAFSVLLGAASPAGVPVELFTSGDATWVGVQVEGEPEQPRRLLVSVPYALKAADANTIGGLPVSAFVLAENPTGGSYAAAGSGSLAGGGDLAVSTTPDRDKPGDANRDQVILDDLIVDGSVCAGFDCVNGESFGFDTLRLKENNLRIKFQDTSTSPSFPSND